MTKTIELIREFDKVTEHIYIQHTQTKKVFLYTFNNGKKFSFITMAKLTKYLG